MKAVTITVLVTTYNHEKFILDCAKSIVNQTRKPDKIILADDNSIDNTIKKFQEIIPSAIISSTSQNNGALINTRNGLKFAHDSDVVCFLDGDDVWHENKLERVEQEFANDPNLLLLTHKHIRCDAKLNILNISDDTHENINRIKTLPARLQNEKFRESALMRRGFWFGSAYSIRLKEKYLNTFDEYIINHELIKYAYFDLVFGPFVIALNEEMKVKYVDDVFFKYRMHDSGSGDAQNLNKQIEVFKRLQANNIITLDLLKKLSISENLKKRYEILIKEHQYLIDLYTLKKGMLKEALQFVGYFIHKKILIKEVLRFLSIVIIGPNKSIVFKNKLSYLFRKITKIL